MKKQILAAVALMLAGHGAGAAKLCAKYPGTTSWGNDWKIGEGCEPNANNATCAKVYVGGTSGKSGAACNDGDEFDALPTAAGNGLFCKRTYPIASKWICANYDAGTSGSGWQCSDYLSRFPRTAAKLLTQFY
ncbi:MAG: hypothetical protein LBL46_01135 [Rickettsiales bacterium]|jgi:hypothetical protein|nr:hypothetical protein [Rickettsiales bacterium]